MNPAAPQSSDAETLARLARSGADLKKPQRLQFLLRFPSDDDAANAAARLKELAFTTTTEGDEGKGEWVVLATKTMYPVESDLVSLREKLNTVAREGHGTYDGWQAARD